VFDTVSETAYMEFKESCAPDLKYGLEPGKVDVELLKRLKAMAMRGSQQIITATDSFAAFVKRRHEELMRQVLSE
jgi:hypothetical protein